MFFENEIISFNILDVLTLKQDNVRMNNSGRNFSALSFRLKADTVLISNGKEYEMKDNTIAFVPANLDYERVSNADELIVIHFDIFFCYNIHLRIIHFIFHLFSINNVIISYFIPKSNPKGLGDIKQHHLPII